MSRSVVARRPALVRLRSAGARSRSHGASACCRCSGVRTASRAGRGGRDHGGARNGSAAAPAVELKTVSCRGNPGLIGGFVCASGKGYAGPAALPAAMDFDLRAVDLCRADDRFRFHRLLHRLGDFDLLRRTR